MKNKPILITGASSGIGEAIAILLARSGYTVFAGVRSKDAIDKLLKFNLDKLHPVILDVTKIEEIENAFSTIQKAVEEFGLMAVINNAGNNYSSPTEYFDEEKASQVLETHFWGMANITKRFLPLLRVYGSRNPSQARIINVGSVGSISAFPFIQFYNAAKFAILGFTESLRFELEPYGIKAIVVLPGAVKTSIWKRTSESVEHSLSKLNEEGEALYRYNMNQASKISAALEKGSIHPEKAALTFKDALEDSRPPFKYFIGTDAKAANFMSKYFSDWLRQALIKIQLKFKTHTK